MRAHYLDTDDTLVQSELQDQGVFYQRLAPEPSVYQPVLDAIKQQHGYVEQDIIELRPETPNLGDVLKKFDDEHLHEEDEVRFLLEGEAIFDIRSTSDRWMRVQVERGDLIVVPKGRHHRFELTDKKTIRCVRLFKDKSGWVPHYRDP